MFDINKLRSMAIEELVKTFNEGLKQYENCEQGLGEDDDSYHYFLEVLEYQLTIILEIIEEKDRA